ncbi:inverse autotransporter beta domain-containing protein, partial [Citrobacter meridianamericanus]|nr:inverse autotransporter beta domain-containing protein [Citrobacter meridianamericanus]
MHRKPGRKGGLKEPVHFRYFRTVVWVNIVCQLLFPLALAFTPAVVAARQTTLGEDMSALQAGLDAAPEPVPVLTPPSTGSPAAAPQKSSLLLPDLGSDAAVKAEGRQKDEPQAMRDERERQEKLNQSMGAAQQLWGVLGGPSPRDQGLDRATGIASGMANQAAQDWLSQFGNARLSFSTQGTGSADVLLPLIDTPDMLLYTQPGLRRSDSRTTGNLGVGARFFTPDWMLGVNSFYDNDFTGNNRRLGVGVEAWRDYLKLSANGYFRLSDWHQSPLSSMQDYDERPANGYDIRAEAYLPAYPQLGGKLMYEHYQGQNVSLDGSTGTLRDNPSAVTVGVSYTPVPLIKLGLDHTAGSGISDTSVKLDFSWRFGVPLVDQLSSDAVGLSRTLAGSRYDLVDRNYDIVLQYRKQDLISLALAADGMAYAGSAVIVTGTVATKYGLKNIAWDAPDLLAAGGTLVPLTATTARVTLPPVSVTARSAGYVIGAVATDNHGNTSNHATLTLVPVRAPQDIGKIQKPQPSTAVADGKSTVTVTVPAVDNTTGTPVALAGQKVTVTFTYTSGSHKGQTVPGYPVTLTTDGDGNITVPVSSTLVGNVSLTAKLDSNGNSVTTAPDFITFTADPATAGFHGKPTVSGDNAVADGKSSVTVTFPVTDANGNPVVNQTVTITTSNGAQPATQTVTTDENGNATVTVTDTTTGKTTVTATINGNSQSQDVNFIPGNPDAGMSSFTAVPATLTADG